MPSFTVWVALYPAPQNNPTPKQTTIVASNVPHGIFDTHALKNKTTD